MIWIDPTVDSWASYRRWAASKLVAFLMIVGALAIIGEGAEALGLMAPVC